MFCAMSDLVVSKCFKLCIAGTIGIVDYTNYDDMKYAVGWLSFLAIIALNFSKIWSFYEAFST